MGLIIDFCDIQPFIVTLAGLFLLRGGCFMINLDSVPIRHDFVHDFASVSIPLPGGGDLHSSAIVMLVAWVVAIVIAHFTRFGANVYAIGGDKTSAALMGVPMRRTMVGIYALGGFYSALGGVIYALYTSSGYPLAGTGNELTAIASVVLGGTLLTGGVGLVARHAVRRHDLRPDRHADQFQRLAQRRVDHDHRRRAAVPVHRAAALPGRFVQAAERGLRLRSDGARTPTFAEQRAPRSVVALRAVRRRAGGA